MKYQTVIIDPPWETHNGFNDVRFYRMANGMPYESMTDEQLADFPLNEVADNRCDLFLWVITSKIPFALELIKKWGFKYMDFFAWDKEIGVPVNGIYRRVEWVIYAYRGKMGINKRGSFIPSMFREKRTKHSRKPDCFYKVLATNTTPPRIDLFARERHEGFDVWGNEVEGDIDISNLSSDEKNSKSGGKL